VIPLNVTARIAIITVSVLRALTHSGALNAGTPSEMASTPVRAAHPDENALKITNRLSAFAPATSASPSAGGGVTGKPASAFRATPTAIITNTPTINM
jgi:hypothetical protein